MTSIPGYRITRRRLAQGALALPVAGPAILGASNPLPAVASDETGGSVPMDRGNAARTGVMPGPGPAGAYGVEPLWTFPDTPFQGPSPAMVDGVVYIGSQDANVYAIDAKTGEERWRFTTEWYIVSSPAVVDGVVYIGSQSENIYALEAKTGQELWRFATDHQFWSSPAVMKGVVYVGNGNPYTNDNNLFALDAESGAELWRFVNSGSGSSPAIVDGVVYVGSGLGSICALDAGTGEERWRFAADYSVKASPAVVGGVVYVGSEEGNVYALDAGSGEERWRFFDEQSGFQYPAAVADGVVYIGNGQRSRYNRGKTIFALSADTGEERWRVSLDIGELEDAWIGPPTYADGVVYVGYENDEREFDSGGVYALKAETGEVRWQYQDGSVMSSIAVVDGVAYVAGRNSVYALVARDPQLELGATARIIRDSPLRGAPSPSGVERERLDEGTLVTVTGESIAAGDGTWWPVAVVVGGREGWVIADDLEPTWPEG